LHARRFAQPAAVTHTREHVIARFIRFRPGWCNGKYLDESLCDTSVEPENWPISGDSCADVCCRVHDKCCGHSGDRSICNPQIVDCLSNCDKLSITCTVLGNPVLPPEIELAMWFVEKLGYCCGTPCSSAELVTLEHFMIERAAQTNSTRLKDWLPNIRAAAAAARASEEQLAHPARRAGP